MQVYEFTGAVSNFKNSQILGILASYTEEDEDFSPEARDSLFEALTKERE